MPGANMPSVFGRAAASPPLSTSTSAAWIVVVIRGEAANVRSARAREGASVAGRVARDVLRVSRCCLALSELPDSSPRCRMICDCV
jgi:hypothetical protein